MTTTFAPTEIERPNWAQLDKWRREERREATRRARERRQERDRAWALQAARKAARPF